MRSCGTLFDSEAVYLRVRRIFAHQYIMLALHGFSLFFEFFTVACNSSVLFTDIKVPVGKPVIVM